MLSSLGGALGILFQPDCLIALVLGTVGGMVVGIIPGLGPSVGIAVLLPLTFTMSPAAALTMMTAIYASGVYGGSITAVLCRTPGTAASAATALDGYELTKQGRGMEAVALCTIASVFGGVVGGLALLLFAPPLGHFSLKFAPMEYFLVACFGLIVVSNLAGKSMAKGLFSAAVGLLLGTVGLDSISGVPRFTFGIMTLEDGIDYTPVLIGLFAVAQVLALSESALKGSGSVLENPLDGLKGRRMPSAKDMRSLMPTMARASIIGTVIGFIPAAGAAISSWINYSTAKKLSKTPELFGHGSMEGIVASEAGNNAACGGAMIPLFTLGIPGSAATAIMFGGLLMHGMIPGNSLFTDHASSTYAIFLGFIAANILMGILGLSLTRQFAKISLVSNAIIVPLIMALSIIGTFALRNNMVDVIVMIVFGVIGYFMRMWEIDAAPMVLGMVLSNILESNFRRALILSRGDLIGYTFNRPISVVLVLIIVGTIVLPFIMKAVKKKTVKV